MAWNQGLPGGVLGLATSYGNGLWAARGQKVRVRGMRREQRLCAVRNRRAGRIGQLRQLPYCPGIHIIIEIHT